MSAHQLYNTKRFGFAVVAFLGALSLIQDFRDPRGYIAALLAAAGAYWQISPVSLRQKEE